jgi:hypothetical protein
MPYHSWLVHSHQGLQNAHSPGSAVSLTINPLDDEETDKSRGIAKENFLRQSSESLFAEIIVW